MEILWVGIITYFVTEIIHRYKVYRLLKQLDTMCDRELDEVWKGGIQYAINQIIGML